MLYLTFGIIFYLLHLADAHLRSWNNFIIINTETVLSNLWALSTWSENVHLVHPLLSDIILPPFLLCLLQSVSLFLLSVHDLVLHISRSVHKPMWTGFYVFL
jgi:hypothetical protein